jgi:thiamine biosynthesis lipoprotein ApbE
MASYLFPWLMCGATVLVAAVSPLQPALRRYEAVEPHMGTLVKIILHAPDEDAARAAFAAAFARIRELDQTLSDYKPSSELNRVTAAAVGAEVRGSRDLIRVLAAAQDLALATGGAFDVTQGPVIRLWREARASGRPPDSESLRLASARSGFRKLHVDREAGTVRLDESGMRLDVGAIGKGYAASEALAILTARGIGSALVAVSGDLAFSGAPPGTRGWRIDMHSAGPDSAIPSVFELTHARRRAARTRCRRPGHRGERARGGEGAGADRVVPRCGCVDRSPHAGRDEARAVEALHGTRCGTATSELTRRHTSRFGASALRRSAP